MPPSDETSSMRSRPSRSDRPTEAGGPHGIDLLQYRNSNRNYRMLDFSRAAFESSVASSVIALHCSLGSGQQWVRLAEELAGRHQVIAPDISGYGSNALAPERPITLAREVDLLSNHFAEASGPLHLVGHSYGGALAFKIATDSPMASRVRSLTLIEPVLPTVLLETGPDRQLHDHFVNVAHEVYEGLRNGSPEEDRKSVV